MISLPVSLTPMDENIRVMTGKDTGKDIPWLTTGQPEDMKGGPDWLVPASVALTAVVAVNTGIVYYLLVALPGECGRLAVRSRGAETCTTGWASYVISGICVALIIIGIYAFVKWNLTRCRSRSGPRY
jgi:hypothetical protein